MSNKIKVNFVVPTKDLKGLEVVPLNVTMNYNDEPLNGQFEFKVVLPDHMYEELANTEPKFSTTADINNKDVSGCFPIDGPVSKKFQKTQTSVNIDVLRDYFQELTAIINKRYSMETQSSKKKIFIRFSHSERHTRNDMNAAYMGETVAQQFNYFVGYEILTEKRKMLGEKYTEKDYVTKVEYHSPMSTTAKRDTNFQEGERMLSVCTQRGMDVQRFEHEYSIIDWTQEREDFCENIKQMFKKVNGDLDEFLKDIDGNKIDQMMLPGSDWPQLKSLPAK